MRGHQQGFLSSKKFTESNWGHELKICHSPKAVAVARSLLWCNKTNLSPYLTFISFIPEKNNISFKNTCGEQEKHGGMRWGDVFYWRFLFVLNVHASTSGQLDHWKPSYGFQRELTVKLNLHSGVHLKQFHLRNACGSLYWARMFHKLDQNVSVWLGCDSCSLCCSFELLWRWQIGFLVGVGIAVYTVNCPLKHEWRIKQADIEILCSFKIIRGISYPLIHKTIFVNSFQYRYKKYCKMFWNRNEYFDFAV